MEYKKLGKTDLNISRITLGTWEFGNEKLWGKVPDKDVNKVINSAVDKGINVIDTAISYEDSEIIVGKAIKNLREKVIVISKGGADPKKIPDRIDSSLKRLGLEYLDLYLVHFPDIGIPIEDTMEAMEKIRNKGKTRYIGVSNFNKEQIEKAASVSDVVCCQSPYNIIWREIDNNGLADFCHKHDIGILTYSSLGQGLFTGKIRSSDDVPKRKEDIRANSVLLQGDVFNQGLEMLQTLDRLADKYNKTVAQIAINWVINQKGITSAIAGIINLVQLDDNLGAIGWDMESEDYELIGKMGSKASERIDYSCSMWGGKYSDVKIDKTLDDMGV